MTQVSESSSADPFTSSLTGRRLGRYEVLARLASGGMAGVYVARALGVAGFERLFAIKVLHPHLAHEDEFITMFLDEARLAARIRHPNVVATIDISDTQDAGFYLVMDYVEGDHLGALLQRASERRTRLPPPVAMRVVVDALDGLGAAHALVDENNRPLNLVHRDVSPHNIMVGTDGVSRLTDFGVAKAEFRISATRDGQFKGKLAYMAPEHAADGVADQRSDLFAMGIILWESLTGRRLFRSENQAATLNKICLEPIPLPSFVDSDLAPFDPILQRALARDPRQRFQNAEEFAEAIERSAGALGGLANQRSVAKIVRTYAAAKLSHDEQLIRSAVLELTRSHAPIGPTAAEAADRMPAPHSQSFPSHPTSSGARQTEPSHGSLSASGGSLGPLAGPQPAAAPADRKVVGGLPPPDVSSLPDEHVFDRPRRPMLILAAVVLGSGLLILGYHLLDNEPEEATLTREPPAPETPETSEPADSAPPTQTQTSTHTATIPADTPPVMPPAAEPAQAPEPEVTPEAAADQRHPPDAQPPNPASDPSWNVVEADEPTPAPRARRRAGARSGRLRTPVDALGLTPTRPAEMPPKVSKPEPPASSPPPAAAPIAAPRNRVDHDDLLLNPYR